MKNTIKRILTSIIMLMTAGAAAIAEYYGIPAVRWLAVAIGGGIIFEFISAFAHSFKQKKSSFGSNINRMLLFVFSMSLLFMVLAAAYFVGAKPWIILLILVIISSADIGAWFFGKLFGGDKMWPALSPNKTWSGQITGVICGTFGAVMYGLLGSDIFMPQLMWIGMSVALLSQYGDLTASWVKRKFGIKDFGNILPGHGGLLDRFDGWIYALPIVWLVML